MYWRMHLLLFAFGFILERVFGVNHNVTQSENVHVLDFVIENGIYLEFWYLFLLMLNRLVVVKTM